MALPNGIPPQLATLLAAQTPQQGPDAKQLALIQALQQASLTTPQGMSMQAAGSFKPQAATGVPSMMPMQGTPGTDSELYKANKGFQDYAPDMVHPEDPSGSPRDRYPADPRSSIDAGEGSYDREPGEDQAAVMAQDAIEGKGTKYPGKSGNDMLHDASNRGSVMGYSMSEIKDIAQLVNDGEHDELMNKYSMSPDDAESLINYASEGRRK